MAQGYKQQELMDMVQVKNRVTDGVVRLTHDAVQWEWKPGEVKTLPRKLAEWFQAKSLFLFYPGDVNEGIPSKSHYKLAIIGNGQDESDLTKAAVAAVKELLDTGNMPELTRIDPQTGQPLRRVYIDPRSTGARDSYSARERQAVAAVSKAIMDDGAEKIADAAARAGTAEVTAAEWKEGLPLLVNPTTGRAVNVG